MGSIVAAWSAREADRQIVQRMLLAAPHRGEPGAVILRGQVALGLSNQVDWVDATSGTEGFFSAVLLGRIDNAQELGRDLALESTEVSGDARLLCHAFERWGEKAVERLRGAFAGIVTDGERLWCFRDHIGGRPLFYRRTGDTFLCGTEPKQVVAGASIERRPNLEAITTTYYRGISEASAVSGVSRLMHGELGALSARGGFLTSRHWNPEELIETSKLGVAEAPEALAAILEKVISRSVSGFDAVSLSGGIDSPTVAAFAAPAHLRLSDRPLGAYTLIYPRHASVDESRYTRLVADYLGLPLHEVETTAGPLDDIEHWVALADGPWDSLPMATAAQGYRVAREAGARRILTGTLAEYVYTVNHFLLGHLLVHGRLSALWRQLVMRKRGGRHPLGLARQIVREVTPAPLARAHAQATKRQRNYLPPWIDITVTGAPRYATPLGAPARIRWVVPTLQATRGTTTTMEAMEMCAASVGVTMSHPLADRDLWEFFLSLPAEVKYPDLIPKSLVRQAMKGKLPDQILDRRDKTVFDEHVLDTVPFDDLRRLLFGSEYRMPGVDYDVLKKRINERTMHPTELVWAYDLAAVHAFAGSFG